MSQQSDAIEKEAESLSWRISLSILVGVAWLVFLLLWLFFYAKHFAWERNIAVLLTSLLFLLAILGVPWAVWAFKKQTSAEKEMWRLKGFRLRIWASIVIMVCLIIFLIFWFWEIAEPFSVYENLAIFVVSILICGGLIAAMWVPWGMKYNPEHFQCTKEQKKE